MRRLLVLLASAGSGAIASAIYIALTFHQLPPMPPHVPGKPEPPPPLEFMAWFFELWIVFLFVTYYCGRYLYRRLGAPSEAELLKQSSEEYLAFIQAVAGCFMLVSGISALIQHRSLRLSLLIGAGLIVAGARDWWRYRLSRRQQTDVNMLRK